MSNAFFNALGYHFQKRASRVPWADVVQVLRLKELLPHAVPRIPFVEPEPLPEPAPLILPVSTEAKEEEEPAPEPRPKSKSESGETSSRS